MTETPSIEDHLKLLQRYWPYGFGTDPDALWAAAKAIYGDGKEWETQFATDLATMRPNKIGGLESKERIDRMMLKRWRSGERPLPEWVATGLLRLPEIIIARRRRDATQRLEMRRKEEREAQASVTAEETRLTGWIAAQIDRHVPTIERNPVKRPPPPRPATPDREWPAVSQEEIEAAEDIGSLAARVEMGAVEREPAPRPEHPVLADGWERGWVEAYDYELSIVREAAERRAAAKAKEAAAAEAERVAKAKDRARREAKAASDRKRRRSK